MLAIAVLGLAACASDRDGEPELTLAVRADITGLFPDPPMQDETWTYDVNGSIYEGLVQFDPKLAPRPALAESWENPDDHTYRFRLRPDLRFSDGRPVTAEDVAASLVAPGRLDLVTKVYTEAVASARAIDARTVEVRTRRPYFLLVHRLHWGFVVPADSLARRPVEPPGTGPYAVAAWHPGRELVLDRNPHYRGPRPRFGRVRFQVQPDADARIARLLERTADVVDHVPLERVDELRRTPGVQVSSGPSLRVLFLGLRVDRPPFSDPRVREAIDLAIDREELVRRAYGGKTIPATQMVPSSIVGHDPSIELVRPDQGRARALLAASGHAEGLRVRLDGTYNRYVNDRAILDEVGRQLALVGVEVTVNALDKAEFFPLVYPPRPAPDGSDMHLLGWECPSGDAGQVLDSVLHSRNGRLGQSNSTGLADAELDRLVETANATRDPADRLTVLQEAMRRAAAVRATLPLLLQAEAVAYSDRIRWQPDLRRSLRPAEMSPAR